MGHRFRSSLGFKLPLGWRQQQAEGRLPGFEGDVYAYLGECGFDYAEFGFGLTLGDNAAVEALVADEAAACAEAGLAVAIHPGPGEEENASAAWFGPSVDEQPGVEPVLRAAHVAAEASGREVVVVLHPAQRVYDPKCDNVQELRDDVVRRSRFFFAALERAVERTEQAVRPVAEHQLPPDPDEPLIRVGDTWGELLEVLADCDLGACWDTGHYILAVQRHGQEPEPPQRFLRRVTHVHLHDVVEGRDHRPVERGSARPRRYLDLLSASGFAGGITLEYAADGVVAAGGPEAVLREAPEVLAGSRP
ncbi:MAG: TIM barrel protein [Candidatus Brocadiia bacterium]